MMKKCSKCRRSKSLSQFSRNRNSPGGYDHYCKVCNKRRMQKYFRSKKGRAAMRRASLKRKK